MHFHIFLIIFILKDFNAKQNQRILQYKSSHLNTGIKQHNKQGQLRSHCMNSFSKYLKLLKCKQANFTDHPARSYLTIVFTCMKDDKNDVFLYKMALILDISYKHYNSSNLRIEKMLQAIALSDIVHLEPISKFVLDVNIQFRIYKDAEIILDENNIFIHIKESQQTQKADRRMVFKLKLDFSVLFQIEFQKAQLQQKQIHIRSITLIKSTQKVKIYPSINKQHIFRFKEELKKRVNQKNFHQYFKAIKKIGKGSFASVFLIQEIGSDQKYAVKAFCKDIIFNQQRGRQSLISEIAIMRKLSHKNLMKIYSVYETQNSIYLILELLEGGTLTQRLQGRKKLSSIEIKTIMKGILQGLQAMHKKQIMHRDIKPDNIIFHNQTDLTPIIADFGLAEVSSAPQYLYTRCGTPGFVAPEIVVIKDNQTKYTCACDLFSAGIIFHFLLLNNPLFKGSSFAEILEQNKLCSFELEGGKYDLLSDSTLNLLKRLLQKDPKSRITASQALQHPYFLNDNMYVRKGLLKNSVKIDSKFRREQNSTKKESIVIGSSFIIKKICRQESCLKFKTKQNVLTGKTQQVGDSLEIINSPQLKKKLNINRVRPQSRFKIVR